MNNSRQIEFCMIPCVLKQRCDLRCAVMTIDFIECGKGKRISRINVSVDFCFFSKAKDFRFNGRGAQGRSHGNPPIFNGT
jgi:hypothetical protein